MINHQKNDNNNYCEKTKRNYTAPTIILINTVNIQGGSSAYVNENSNGGAFTNAS